MRHLQTSLPTLAQLGTDLVRLNSIQVWRTVAVPFVCVAAYFCFAFWGWWPAAVLAVMAYSFFSYGSTSHDLVHGNLHLATWLNSTLLSAIEILGLRSGHAYRAVHLFHHQHFPHDDDVEGSGANSSWLGALFIVGPPHQLKIWIWAMRHAKRDRVWIICEGLAIVLLLVAAIALCGFSLIPIVYIILVVMGSWTFPIITARLPHDPHGNDELSQTRRFRGKVADLVFGQHLYHLEHHLYPSVPHHHWRTLASRLDPYLDQVGVKPICFGF